MPVAIPAEHVAENQKLEADAYVDLFKIRLRSGATLYLKNNKEGTWQGNLFESYAINLTGVGDYSDDQVSRPTLQLWNPEGIFSPLVRDKELDRALVTRYRVLRTHFENDNNIYQARVWVVGRVASLTDAYITVELRTPTDGQFFIVPARQYMPPEFPLVSLQ